MKRLFSFLLLLAIPMTLLFSLDLTPEEAREYNLRMLSITTKTIHETSTTATGWEIGSHSSFVVGTTYTTSSVEWTPHQGAETIRKSEFFRLAGYEEYEKICRDLEERNRKLKKAGIIMSAAGWTGVGVGIVLLATADEAEDKDKTQKAIGTGLLLGGLAPGLVGLEFLIASEKEPDIAPAFAVGVADAYNRELAAEISLRF